MFFVSKQLCKVITFPTLQMKKLGVAKGFMGLRVVYPGFECGFCFARLSPVTEHFRGLSLRPSSPAAGWFSLFNDLYYSHPLTQQILTTPRAQVSHWAQQRDCAELGWPGELGLKHQHASSPRAGILILVHCWAPRAWNSASHLVGAQYRAVERMNKWNRALSPGTRVLSFEFLPSSLILQAL